MEPRTFATPNGLHLEVRVSAGTVEIEATDTAETTLEVRNEHDPHDFRVELFELPEGGHRCLVVEEHRRKVFGFGLSRDVLVRARVPRGTRVDVSSGSADLAARGHVASLAFRSG